MAKTIYDIPARCSLSDCKVKIDKNLIKKKTKKMKVGDAMLDTCNGCKGNYILTVNTINGKKLIQYNPLPSSVFSQLS